MFAYEHNTRLRVGGLPLFALAAVRFGLGPAADLAYSQGGDFLPRISSGACSRSSSGRFIVNAATTIPFASHQTLKLLVFRSPRCIDRSACDVSPQNSYERSNTS